MQASSACGLYASHTPSPLWPWRPLGHVLASRQSRLTSYNTHYLALAEIRSCAVWTGDERLYNAVHTQLPRLRWVGSSDAAPR
jgi:hypothetical protein